MKDRKQTGAKGDYLCSRLVYCRNCGAKMHASSPTRKGHTYPQYTCSKHCGIGSVRAELVDEAAKMYLHELLTDEVQTEIEKALRQYNRTEKSRVAEHNEIIKKQLADKQRQIDALMGNLSAGVLPPEVVKEIGEKITILKQEKEVLATVEPPRDFTTEQIITWLKSIRIAPDETAVRLLIERIEVKKDKEKATTEFSITSTLNSVVGKTGCGDRT